MSDTGEVIETPEEYKARIERSIRDSEAAGAATPAQAERPRADYFGFGAFYIYTMPDGVSTIQHKAMNEGARRRYQSRLSQDVKVERGTGNAIMKMQAGDERRILLEEAICGWDLMANGQPVPFNANRLHEFLENADPIVVDGIERDIRKHNPWLTSEASLDDLRREMNDLQERIDQKIREEEGKAP
jgi:hypothetical protein